MNFPDAIKSGFGNYVTFSGRAARSEYWFWTLFVFLGAILCGLIDGAVLGATSNGPLGLIFTLATFLPGLSVAIRRLHDTGRSGWLFLLILIPIVGAILLLIWFCMRGTVGDNRFGPDPL